MIARLSRAIVSLGCNSHDSGRRLCVSEEAGFLQGKELRTQMKRVKGVQEREMRSPHSISAPTIKESASSSSETAREREKEGLRDPNDAMIH